MSKKTYAIVAGIIGAVTTAIESIIPLFDLPKESLILGAVAAAVRLACRVWRKGANAQPRIGF